MTRPQQGGIKAVSSERAWAHYYALYDQFPSLTVGHFARLAGIAHTSMHKVRDRGRISPETEERILAVTIEQVRENPPPRVAVRFAQEHILMLTEDSRVSAFGLSKITGITDTTIANIARGRYQTIRWYIHEAILAVTPDQAREVSGFRPREPLRTMLGALGANGWSANALAAELGYTGNAVRQIVDPTRPLVSTKVYAQIKALYDRIGDTPGPSDRDRRRYREMGYYPPIYYDDDMVLHREWLPGRETKTDPQERARGRLRALLLSVEGGRPTTQIVEMVGISDKRITETRRRVGLQMANPSSGGLYGPTEGQDDLIALIYEHAEGIEAEYQFDSFDTYGIDYGARYEALCEAVDALRKAEGQDRPEDEATQAA